MASLTAEHVAERIKAKEKELGRKLTPQELIEIINRPEPDEDAELTYESDEEP
jgi:Ca2+-binding EF-hand superfamily protein